MSAVLETRPKGDLGADNPLREPECRRVLDFPDLIPTQQELRTVGYISRESIRKGLDLIIRPEEPTSTDEVCLGHTKEGVRVMVPYSCEDRLRVTTKDRAFVYDVINRIIGDIEDIQNWHDKFTAWSVSLEYFCRNKGRAFIDTVVASWRALELLMNPDEIRFEDSGVLGARAAGAWLGEVQGKADENVAKTFYTVVENARGVRERSMFIKKYFKDVVRKKITEGATSFHALDIACGSGRTLYEAISELIEENVLPQGFDLQVKLIDADPQAVVFSKELAKEMGLGAYTSVTRGNITNLASIVGEDRFDFVGYQGIADYLPARLISSLLIITKNHMNPGGVVMISNIRPNLEQVFLHRVVGWLPMIYRDVVKRSFNTADSDNRLGFTNEEQATSGVIESFPSLAIGAGYSADLIEAYIVPSGLYTVLALKTS